MTFSLAGLCARTGMLGAIVASSSPAVAARCARARAATGAACSQNVTDPALGGRLLDEVAAGRSARAAMDIVVANARYPEYRQLTVIDRDGGTAVYSGAKTLGRHGTAIGDHAVAAGNLLSADGVPQAMVDAFSANPDDHLGDRLIAALTAGESAGGEEGPIHSCGLLVVDSVSWPTTDLRVDWSENPLADLALAWSIWKPQADDYVARALDPQSAPTYGVPGDE